ncbi:MAG: Holliday junction branch migration protein RuvA [Methanomicrobiales archaeon]|nr:Holliday junction branch migration protein RuvA [Methanomicrobiales archaeon]MDD1654803.1 Holliday junction branch migration protein RuvA [Methanomicrobiales archaeon]
MFAQLTGEVADVGEGMVVLDVRGVGYEVHMPQPAVTALLARKGPVTVHTHLVVRDDGWTLYGFLRPRDREMFRLLIGVTRIGPQIALSILSQITLEDLAAAVLAEDDRALTRIPGVGEKHAKRLILELRDKMKKAAEKFLPGGGPASMRLDAVSALVALGFSPRESGEAVDAVLQAQTPPASVQDVVKTALQRIRER